MFSVKTPSKQDNVKILTSDSQENSEISDDVFIKPKPLSLTTKSRSYIDKINERFKSVKEKAGKSTKKANVFKEAAENILLEKVKRESKDIDAELELIRERLKLDKPNDSRRKYDFFTNENLQETEEKEIDENFKSTDDLTDNQPEIVFSLPQSVKQLVKDSENSLFFKPQT